MNIFKRLLFLIPLLAAPAANAAEFEVVDKFSANNYSEFRGSAAVVTDDLSSSGILWVSTYGAATPNLYVSTTGNVGIGTASPAYKLEVVSGASGMAIQGYKAGADGIYSSLYFRNTASGMAGITAGRSVDNYGTQLDFLTGLANAYGGGDSNTAVRMTIAQNGNVGIGTAAPEGKLDIRPDASASMTALRLAGPSSSPIDYEALKISFFGRSFLDSATRETARIQARNYAGGSHYGDLSFWTMNATILGQRMIIDASGNVGIGTTAPDNKLTVYNGSQSIYSASWELFLRSYNSPLKNLRMGFIEPWNAGAIQVQEDGVGYLPLALQYQGGNVGIGTTAPVNKMQIEGTEAADTTYLRIGNKPAVAGHNSAGMEIWGNDSVTAGGTYNIGRIYGHFDTTTYSGARLTLGSALGSGTFNDELTLKNGSVGIGTTAPGAELHVMATDSTAFIKVQTPASKGNAADSLLIFSTNNDGNAAVIGLNDDQLGQLSFKAGSTDMDTGSGGPHMTIKTNGNVGIGTTSPGVKLEVNGAIAAAGGSANHAICWKADGKTLGYCSAVVDSNGACGTCN